MDDTNAKLQRFFNACDELINGKFILADTKIGELLRSVAACAVLTGLFSAVTDGFDYPAAKKAYLKLPESEGGRRGEVFLPPERKDILAFVFCLLVEIDSGAVKLNDFLLRYFYEDGSYTASYALFVGRMIRPFRDIVRECFPDLGRDAKAQEAQRREEYCLQQLSERVVAERTRIGGLSLGEEDAFAAERMLAELYAAVGRQDLSEIKAILCGYLYFLQVTGAGSENSDEMFAFAGEL